MSFDILSSKCDVCAETLHEPYIECCDCETNLCCQCFASGQEVNQHKNDHRYAVRKNDFPLFLNCNWTAKEECKLLSAISTHGFGNWEEVAKMVHTRSKLECQEHYKKYYIENIQYKSLELLPETLQSLFCKPLTPYLCNMNITFNPPRNNQSDPHLAGYNAFRSEFELSYDHNAESIFSIEDSYSDSSDEELMDSLKVSLANALNTRLKERQRRYGIIQEHGLIMPHKLASWVQRYEHTLTRLRTERLLSFMHFMTAMQFDAFVESLHLEVTLIQKLLRLQEYRRQGIKSLYSAKVYRELKTKHDQTMKYQKKATAVMMKEYEGDGNERDPFLKCMSKTARARQPLDIIDMPNYQLLSNTEKTLCSNMRLTPQHYLDIKDLLICESNKLGSLKLLDARKLVKIDVNKTKVIYEYLTSEGFIAKPY